MTKQPPVNPKQDRVCSLCEQPSYQSKNLLYPSSLPSKLNSKTFSARRLPDKIHYQYFKCPNDGLIFASPILEEITINSLYKNSQVTYQTEISNLIDSYLHILNPVLDKLSPNAKIVEIGAGSGFMIEALHSKNFKKAIGVEPSTDAISQASKKVQNYLIKNIFKPSLFKKKSLDLIFLLQTFDHLSNPNKFLEDAYSLLKPGGLLFSLHHDFDAWPRKILGRKHPIIDIEHPNLYTFKTTIAMWQKHGFLVDKTTSPRSKISLSHLTWLLPLPKNIKTTLSKNNFLQQHSLKLKLGNIAIIGRKPSL